MLTIHCKYAVYYISIAIASMRTRQQFLLVNHRVILVACVTIATLQLAEIASQVS